LSHNSTKLLIRTIRKSENYNLK